MTAPSQEARTPFRHYTINALSPSEGAGQGEFTMRQAAAANGCEALCHAIEELVKRTAKRLDIPAQWRAKPLSFARAYLGMKS